MSKLKDALKVKYKSKLKDALKAKYQSKLKDALKAKYKSDPIFRINRSLQT